MRTIDTPGAKNPSAVKLREGSLRRLAAIVHLETGELDAQVGRFRVAQDPGGVPLQPAAAHTRGALVGRRPDQREGRFFIMCAT